MSPKPVLLGTGSPLPTPQAYQSAAVKLLTEWGAQAIAFDRTEFIENCDIYIPIDLSDEASIAEAVEKFDGSTDTLCNIAGVPPTLPLAPVLQVNFLGLRAFTEARQSPV